MKNSSSVSRVGFLGLVIFVANIGQSLAACPPVLILERSTNKNRVHYEANLKTPSAPISAKWEMREKGPGKWEELTNLERNKAYGVKLKSSKFSGDIQFAIAGVPSKIFTLGFDGKTGCPVARFAPASGPEMIVEFVQLTMKKSLVPAVEKVQFIGKSKDGAPMKLDVKI